MAISSNQEKRPRFYAVEIICMDDRNQRAQYLQNQVPPHLRDWVSHYVRLWWPNRDLIRAENDQTQRLPNRLY